MSIIDNLIKILGPLHKKEKHLSSRDLAHFILNFHPIISKYYKSVLLIPSDRLLSMLILDIESALKKINDEDKIKIEKVMLEKIVLSTCQSDNNDVKSKILHYEKNNNVPNMVSLEVLSDSECNGFLKVTTFSFLGHIENITTSEIVKKISMSCFANENYILMRGSKENKGTKLEEVGFFLGFGVIIIDEKKSNHFFEIISPTTFPEFEPSIFNKMRRKNIIIDRLFYDINTYRKTGFIDSSWS